MMRANPFALVPARGNLLCYIAANDEWSILWRCDRCGGTDVPLIERFGTGDGSNAIPDLAEATRRHGCPGCHARTKRDAADTREPDVWWDPGVAGWLVRVPVGERDTAVLPLEIRWFDAPRALIHCAAADVVYAGDRLLCDRECDPALQERESD